LAIPAKQFTLFKKGVARIYYFKDGIDVTESFFFESSIIARVESLFTGKPSRKAIQILEDARNYCYQCQPAIQTL
jgi:hypothetical protein